MSDHFTARGDPIWGKATIDEHVEHEKKWIASMCIHFNGVSNDQCEAGVTYWPQGPQPCFADIDSPHTCTLRVFLAGEALTQAARERVAEIDASLKEMTRRHQAQECIQCGKPWEERRQIGPCIYAYPCGCRQGQGKIKGRIERRTA